MQDYRPIAGQRVPKHKCGSEPPNAGHLAPMRKVATTSHPYGPKIALSKTESLRGGS